MLAPEPNPATVEALHDIAWRIASSEAARTQALDGKASTLTTFASLLISLTATLGARVFEETAGIWAAALFAAVLASLLIAVAFGVSALLPSEYVTLGSGFLRRFPTWGEIRKPPEAVRGETIQGLVRAVARERQANERKARLVRAAFSFLLIGLVLTAIEAATLAGRSAIE